MWCQLCKAAGKAGKMSYHNSTTSLVNHLKFVHKIEQSTCRGVPHGEICSCIFFCTVEDQKSMNAYRSMASAAKEELSSKEYICAIWARNALPFRLLHDALFRQQFGISIPPQFDRKALSMEMHNLADKIWQKVCSKINKEVITIGVDGWTNVRREKMYNIMALTKDQAYFVDSVDIRLTFM